MYDESRLPLNRVVAFLGPYISIAAGAIASWLLVHVHALGLFHVQKDGLATGIAQGLVFALTALLAWAGQSKWLKGHHITLAEAGLPAVAGLPATAGLAPIADIAAVPGSGADTPPEATDINPEPEDAQRTQVLAAAVGGTGSGSGNGNGAGEPAVAPPVIQGGTAMMTEGGTATMTADAGVTDEEEFADPSGAFTYPEVEAAEDDGFDGAGDGGDMPESRTTPDNPEEL